MPRTSSGYRTPSEPIPETNSSTSRRPFRANEYFDDRTNRENDRRPRRSKTCRRKSEAEKESESRGIRLFDRYKKDKDYDDAEKLYHEIMKGRDPTENEDILNLNHSYAALLVEQKKFQDAEPISMRVWEKRKEDPGPLSEVSKESHRQLSSILCAVGKYKDAQKMHSTMYESEPTDAWTLENGDDLCQRLTEQGNIKKAKEVQDEVWEKRLIQNGPRDGLTIKSGLRLIEFLRQLIATIETQDGHEHERRLNASEKQALECKIVVVLRRIWDARPRTEPTSDTLTAGDMLGDLIFRREDNPDRFADAEAIFTPVWEGKKRQFGDGHASTMATGSILAKALCHQGDQETYHRAVDILRNLWPTMTRNGDPEAIVAADYLAQAYFSISEWLNAEQVYRWILQHKMQNRFPTRDIEDARWFLGQTLYKQGTNRQTEAHTIFNELYQQWYASSPNSSKTLDCGYLLAQLLSTQPEKAEEARKVALDVFNGRRASPEKGAAYVNSGYLYGLLLEKDGKLKDAESILLSLWENEAVFIEDQKVRWACGHLTGQIRIKRRRHSEAKKILEEVVEAQEAGSAGILEVTETQGLIKEAVNKLKKEKGRRNNSRWSLTFAKR